MTAPTKARFYFHLLTGVRRSRSAWWCFFWNLTGWLQLQCHSNCRACQEKFLWA